MTYRIQVTDLSIDLPASGHVIVEGLNLTVRPGEIVGVVGESGSGKTSIGLALLGFTRRGTGLGGSVRIDGHELLTSGQEAVRAARGRSVAYVAQDPGTALTPSMRIGAQLREVIETHDPTTSAGDARRRVEKMLGDVNLPSDSAFLRRYPHQLSGGQQQRICIAMAFLLDPLAVVLDEPTTGLDVVTQAKVLELVRRMCRERATGAVYISHDLAVVAELADRVVVLYAGRVVEEGPRETVLQRPRHPYTSSLLSAVPGMDRRRLLASIPGSTPPPGMRPSGCEFHPRCPVAVADCSQARPALHQLAPDHLVRCRLVDETSGLPSIAPALPDLEIPLRESPVLSVSGLRVSYGPVSVLTDVSLDLARGECLAIVGESGSGKTTLARTLVGLVAPTAGMMTLRGARLSPEIKHRSRQDRQAIQYVFQNPYGSLNPRKTVEDILVKPLRVLRSLDPKTARREAASALERVGLQTSMLRCYPQQLSGGERQRVAVARAVACEPEVLICDEVTSALDVSAQAAIVGLLRKLVDELDLALIFVTHDLALVRSIAERSAVLNCGRIVELGDTAKVIAAPQHPYTRSLVEASPSLVAIET